MKNPQVSLLSQPEDLLRRVQVASPCTADWEQMTGDDQVRHCPECNLNVYNLSTLTVREAAHLISTHQGRLCARYYRRADGTMLTQDCPRGTHAPVRRVSRIAGAALSAAMTVSFAAGQTTPQPESQPLVQIDRNESGIVVEVKDSIGAAIRDIQVTLLNQSNHKEQSGTPDASGTLRLLHLPAGAYHITVSSPGYVYESRVVSLREQQIATLSVTREVVATQGLVEITVGDIIPTVVVDAVPIPLEPVATVDREAATKKPLLKRMFLGVRHKLGL